MLSEAVQDYLKVIYKLANQPTAGATVTTSIIAERMEVSPASATNMIKKLAEMRLLEHIPYQGVALTNAGEKIALEIIRHHRLIELYLSETLGFQWDQLDAEADRLEHAISEDFEESIDRALGHPTVGAHGEPIPTRSGDIAVHDYVRLCDLAAGEKGRIRQVSDRSPELLRYLEEHGLTLGAEIQVHRREPFEGPLRLTIDTEREHHLGLEVAASIFVEQLS